MGIRGSASLANALPEMSALRDLNIAGNALLDHIIRPVLCTMVDLAETRSFSLEKLDISNNRITPQPKAQSYL